MKVQYKKFISYLTVAFLFGFLFLSFTYAGVGANTDELPPRPTGVPSPEPEQPPTDQPVVAHPDGGFIALSMEAPSPDYWVTVQWHDGKDAWHTITGWQGHFDHKGEILWWVAPEDMGKGPFRWVVLSAEVDGRPVAVSDEFYLPAYRLQTIESLANPTGSLGIQSLP